MLLTYTRTGVLVAMLTVSVAACSEPFGEAGANAGDPGEPRGLGTVQEAYCTGHSIVNVAIAPGTYHWEDSAHLLNSAEGFGPRTIGIAISDAISPSSSASSTYTPTESEISSSVGYDITATFAIDASTTVFVPFGGYARLMAFATFEVTTWDIIGTNCFGPADAGTGVSYKPVGVYFKTCEAYDCSLGGGVVAVGPIPSGPGSNGAGGGSASSGSAGSGSASSGSAGSGSASSGSAGSGSSGSASSGSAGSGSTSGGSAGSGSASSGSAGSGSSSGSAGSGSGSGSGGGV